MTIIIKRMYNKAIWKYFWDINVFNIPFSLIIGLISGLLWSIIIFSSLGIVIGYLGYKTFKNNQYYVYYNLGLTKTSLLKKVWLLNMIISFLLFLIYIIIR
ncbi:hypothetical protein GCM10007384_34080 [Aquimarina muelleri]|uniref:Uncharacterized protein n=1 Tax=Aquimarina muelleri TaxID=279356 RepID=A0A918JYZ1_9FLAO|nr:hypothetical protein GCM10007384_34080 [Aquimarina muelleri]